MQHFLQNYIQMPCHTAINNKQGEIAMRVVSTRTHTMVGLAIGVVLILAPNLLGFSDNDSASAVARAVGVLLLLNELMTNNGLSPLRVIPMKVHLLADLLVGLFLALSPWLYGFADDGTDKWLPHVVVGLLVAGYSLVTKTEPDDAPSNN